MDATKSIDLVLSVVSVPIEVGELTKQGIAVCKLCCGCSGFVEAGVLGVA